MAAGSPSLATVGLSRPQLCLTDPEYLCLAVFPQGWSKSWADYNSLTLGLTHFSVGDCLKDDPTTWSSLSYDSPPPML